MRNYNKFGKLAMLAAMKHRIIQERLQQARYSFYLFAFTVIAFTMLSSIGIGLVLSGKTEGIIIVNIAVKASVDSLQLLKNASNRLDKIIAELLELH